MSCPGNLPFLFGGRGFLFFCKGYIQHILSLPSQQSNALTLSLIIFPENLQSRVYVYVYWSIGLVVSGLGGRGSIPGRVIQKTQKWYLISPCLTLSIIRNGSRVKWCNTGKGVVPFPTPWCSSY